MTRRKMRMMRRKALDDGGNNKSWEMFQELMPYRGCPLPPFLHITILLQYNTIQYNTIQYHKIQLTTVQFQCIQHRRPQSTCPVTDTLALLCHYSNKNQPGSPLVLFINSASWYQVYQARLWIQPN